MKYHTQQLIRGPQTLEIRCTPDEIQLNDTDLRFIGEVQGELKLTLVDKGRVLAQGSVTGLLLFHCVRCLEEAMSTLTGPIMAVYEAHSNWQEEPDPFDDPEDQAMVRFNGEVIDLAPQIREAIMMQVPDFPLCRPDCKGLCLQCGVNLNHQPCTCKKALGDLPSWKAQLLNFSASDESDNAKG
jgi:uncharacterized protein